MKKKTITLIAAGTIIASTLTIPTLQALATSALSFFRVGSAKTIEITLSDIEEFANYVKANQDKFEMHKEEATTKGNPNQERPKPKTLVKVKEFTAFNFNLPRDIKETPILEVYDASSKKITINTDKINQALTKAGSKTILDQRWNGTEVEFVQSAVITAKYADVMLMATQGAVINAPEDAKNALWSAVLDLPMIPNNVRAQLQKIDINTRDIYLPVIMGVSREVDLGGSTGYLYTHADMKAVTDALPDDLFSEMGNQNPDAMKAAYKDNDKSSSTLIWSKNGVLYVLTGSKTDGELSAIARSIRS